jgi:hypothetical protein
MTSEMGFLVPFPKVQDLLLFVDGRLGSRTSE